MKYALLFYKTDEAEQRDAISPELAGVLARPSVKSWARLQPSESATTLASSGGKTVLTDGPFVDSKEYLGGLVVIEAPNLDEALAIAAELQSSRSGVAVELRPILEDSERSA